MSADGRDPEGGAASAADLRPVHERLSITPPAQVAAAALNRARAAAQRRGFRPGKLQPARERPVDQRSGAGADARDPALVGETLARLAAERGWQTQLSVGSVRGRWAEIVGDDVAEHSDPETFDDGVLVVRAESTSWATHLRFLAPDLLRRLAEEVGDGVVREVRVLGPAGPRWERGPRRVPGRGVRDTYG